MFQFFCKYYIKPELLVRKSRTTFDNTEVSKEFGPVIIHYQSVQKKVNDKYDMWHKDVLTKFGGMLGQDIHNFFSAVTKVGLFYVIVLTAYPPSCDSEVLHSNTMP